LALGSEIVALDATGQPQRGPEGFSIKAKFLQVINEMSVRTEQKAGWSVGMTLVLDTDALWLWFWPG
jgi:hypothetical protein